MFGLITRCCFLFVVFQTGCSELSWEERQRVIDAKLADEIVFDLYGSWKVKITNGYEQKYYFEKSNEVLNFMRTGVEKFYLFSKGKVFKWNRGYYYAHVDGMREVFIFIPPWQEDLNCEFNENNACYVYVYTNADLKRARLRD